MTGTLMAILRLTGAAGADFPAFSTAFLLAVAAAAFLLLAVVAETLLLLTFLVAPLVDFLVAVFFAGFPLLAVVELFFTSFFLLAVVAAFLAGFLLACRRGCLLGGFLLACRCASLFPGNGFLRRFLASALCGSYFLSGCGCRLFRRLLGDLGPCCAAFLASRLGGRLFSNCCLQPFYSLIFCVRPCFQSLLLP